MPIGDMDTAPAALGLKGNGELTDDTTRTQFPEVKGRVAVVKALAANAGNVYVAANSAVTVTDATTDVTTGFELAAGESITLTLGTFDLDELYLIAATSGDGVCYLVYG